MALVKIEDVIVPELFTPAVIRATAEQSVLVQSGAIVASGRLNAALAGGGLVFNETFFNSLARTESNVSSDDEDDFYTGGAANSTPRKMGSGSELQIRQSRNASWASSDLAAALTAEDPMGVIANDTGAFWAADLQANVIATMQGVFADNDAAPVGSEHVQGDLSNDISGGAYAAGTTDIGGGAFIDALATMGDRMGDLALLMVHSIVYAKLLKQGDIDFVKAADNDTILSTYKGKAITMSDAMPNTGGVFDTWIFGRGAVALGQGSPAVPTEIKRMPDSGNGGGSTVLYNRAERIVHPVGHKYVGAQVNGGPANSVLANAASWERAFPERKQIAIARLLTREF